MCPLHNLIRLLDSFKHFKNVTKTKVEEYESCALRFRKYMSSLERVENGHLATCDNVDCSCYEYLYETPKRLIDEIIKIIAVSYIINFEYVRMGAVERGFTDMSCGCYNTMQ